MNSVKKTYFFLVREQLPDGNGGALDRRTAENGDQEEQGTA